MTEVLHTVVETPAYLRDADSVGMDATVRAAVVDAVAANPALGDEIRGSGGVRKFRFAGRGKGKSGGYRIVSAWLGADMPVYLLAVLSKGEQANFGAAEIAAFRAFTTDIKRIWRSRRHDKKS